MKVYLFLVPAALSALMALSVGGLAWKLMVPAACALAILSLVWVPTPLSARERAILLLALLACLVGDYFLATRSGHSHYFEFGIAAFLIAHLCLVRYALWNGKLHLRALLLLLLAFLPYYGLALAPRFKEPVLAIAVLLYLLVSCLGFASACGIRIPRPSRQLYVASLGLLLFSDTLISLSEFLHYRTFNAWILPTYYLFLIGVTASAVQRRA